MSLLDLIERELLIVRALENSVQRFQKLGTCRLDTLRIKPMVRRNIGVEVVVVVSQLLEPFEILIVEDGA